MLFNEINCDIFMNLDIYRILCKIRYLPYFLQDLIFPYFLQKWIFHHGFIIIQQQTQSLMKLHYSSEQTANNRYRKVKAVASALGVNLEEVAHDSSADVTTISPFNTLPLLQTAEGTFFSSNTIVRYLANTQGKLYGGQNHHNSSLVDQWLDVTVIELEPAVAAIAVATQGKETVDTTKVVEDIHKFLNAVEGQINGRKFLVGEQLTIADISLATALSVVFSSVLGEEERKAYPSLTAWYLNVAGTDKTIGSTDLPKESHKSFKGKKAQKQEKKPEKKEEKKEEKKPEPAAEDDDLFGDSPAPTTQAPKPKPQPIKPKKEKPAAKSMVVFDVKVHEMETDLHALFKRIVSEITMDGLTWSPEPKIVPIAYGMNKLQVSCVVEDQKVSVDDIYEKIESWEDLVQSTDNVSFQKL